MVSFFLSAKLEESINEKKSMTSTIKETEVEDNKSSALSAHFRAQNPIDRKR